MPVTERSPYLLAPGSGEVTWDGPVGTTVMASNESTGGLLSVCEVAGGRRVDGPAPRPPRYGRVVVRARGTGGGPRRQRRRARAEPGS